MNFIQKALFNKGIQSGLSYKPMFNFSVTRDVFINLRGGRISFDIHFPNRDKKIFFIDNNFTFNHLRDLIKVEYPYYSLNYDFSQTDKAKTYDENTQVSTFLNDDTQGLVTLSIDSQDYSIRNIGSFQLNQEVQQLWTSNKQQGLNLYKKCIEKKLSPSHSGVLSHFLNKFLKEIEKYGDRKLTEVEVDQVFEKCIQNFSDPVRQKLEYLYQKRNELYSQYQALEKEKIEVENAAQRKINFYIKLLFLVSVLHISSFYYMIFHVDWLGWDIIEPITYSIQVFTMLLGIRFYMRYRKNRGIETMQEIWRNKMINKNRLSRDRYADILQNLHLKDQALKNIDTKINIYKNRKNYIQFLNKVD